MKIGTFLWGIFITLCGSLAIIRGLGTHFDGSTLAVAVLLIFALACTVAALMPQRQPQTMGKPQQPHDPLLFTQPEGFEVEPTPHSSHE